MTVTSAEPITTAIPLALRERDQWVTWRYIRDPKKPDKPKKMPFVADPQGRAVPAESNNPDTWSSYDEAVAVCAQRRHNGVGYVFAKDDPFAGGDLDGCLDEDGQLKPWAAPIVVRLLAVAYIEISPSGRGLKFITRASIAKALSQKERFGPHEGVELYDWGRYFTITGQQWPGSAAEPQDGQVVVDALYTELAPAEPAPELPPLPAPVAAAAAPLPATGWRGDRMKAVDERLVHWVQECLAWARDEMKAALDGDKHNCRLRMGKFLGGVIATAPGHLSPEHALNELYDAKKPEAHHSQELRAIRDGLTTGMGLPLTPGAVGDKDGRDYMPTDDDLKVVEGRACCPRCATPVKRSRYDYGPGMAPGWYCPKCKWPMVWPLSAWAGGEVAQVAAGTTTPAQPASGEKGAPAPRYRFLVGAEIDTIRMPRWLVRGYMALGAVTVVWGPSESGKTPLLVDIVERVARHHTVIYIAAEDAAGLRARMRAWELHHEAERGRIIVMPEALPLADDLAVEQFIAQARPQTPRLVVVDTLNPCIIGLDENSNSDMGAVAVRLIRIAEALDCHVAVLHHPTKDGAGLRGASAILNNTSAIWHVEKGGDDLITVRQTRNKQGGRRDDRFFRIMARPIDMADDQGQPLTSVLLLTAAKMTRNGDKSITKQERELLRLIADADDAGDPMGTAELMEACGVSRKQPGSFYRMVKHLKEECRYVEKGEKKTSPFTITPAGRRALEGAQAPREAAPEPDSPWEIAETISTGEAAVIPADEVPETIPVEPPLSTYTALAGYDDDAPPPEEPHALDEEPPLMAEPEAGAGEAEREPEPGPSVAQGMAERLKARKGGQRAAAD